MEGRVHLFKRDHINTDEIIPARYLTIHDEAQLAGHAMEDIDRDFAGRVQAGDLVVGGENFGCGSSREHAIWALRGAGVQAVLADSFARIFYRNAVNNAFYALELPGISTRVREGDLLEIDVQRGLVTNRTRNESYLFAPFSVFVQGIYAAGGLLGSIAAGTQRRENQ